MLLLADVDPSAGSWSVHAWIAIGVLVAAMALFISRAIPLAVTALSLPVVLAVTGTLAEPRDAIAGFGNGAVIALAGVFILGAGLEATGVATIMGRGLERLGGRSETRIVVVIMLFAASDGLHHLLRDILKNRFEYGFAAWIRQPFADGGFSI